MRSRYFNERWVFLDLDFSAMNETQPEDLFAAWLARPEKERNEMDAEFRDIRGAVDFSFSWFMFA